MEYKRKNGRHPLHHSPEEIVPDLDTIMVNIVTGERTTLGRIWAYYEHRDVEVARKAALAEKPENDERRAREAADNLAVQEIAYKQYEEREGRPYTYAGTLATEEVVEQPAPVAASPVAETVPSREAALV